MRTSRFNIWKLTSLLLFVLVGYVFYQYFREYQRNLPYKKDFIFIQKSLEKAKQENLELQKQIILSQHPLNIEKERKDKFGQANEDEKMILISDDLLKNTILPIFKK